jgi:uncharacterized FAD-dependent dehydrogenase
MIKISDIRLPVEAGTEDLKAAAAGILGLKAGDLLSMEILREAVDARHKVAIRFAYVVAVETRDEEIALKAAPSGKAERYNAPFYMLPAPGEKRLAARPVVVGAGPAGMFAAWVLARAGYAPLVLERGRDMERRRADVEKFRAGGGLDEESNMQFGEGGAGAFSDGKLTARARDARFLEILKQLVKCGAPEEILFSARAHMGTDCLAGVIPAMRHEIESLGGEYRFSQAVDGLIIKDGGLAGLKLRGGGTVDCRAAVLAIGHSARDTLANLLAQGMALEPKSFAVGFRVEHPQRFIDRAVWGRFAGNKRLGAAEYHLSCNVGGRTVYSFCMCPGGSVVNTSSEEGRLVVNGMSLYARAGANANSAVVAAVSADEAGAGVLSGVEFQRALEENAYRLGEDWHAPAQRMEDYMAARPSKGFGSVLPSVGPEAVPRDLNGLLPGKINEAVKEAIRNFDRQLPGFMLYDAVLTAVESRTSSPVRMARGEDMQASGIGGLYPAGEGAGYAGGILSAAADGMKAAEALIAQWRVKG